MMRIWMKLGALGAAGAALCLFRSEYERKALSVEDVEILSSKIRSDRTLVFLSDLHNNTFGPDNQRLIQAVDQVRPDGVLIGGDMMVVKGQRDTRVPLALIQNLVSRYPVYYGNGNHENRMVWERGTYGSLYETYRDRLKAMGVHYLEDSQEAFGEDLVIGGVDLDERYYQKFLFSRPPAMKSAYLERKLGRPDPRAFTILLAHSPLYFSAYADWGADLVLSGHFHGGTIRLPFLGGVMTPQYQFFLPWCAGEFTRGKSRMIVSRGLGTHSINIRLNNRPQLVVIRLKPEKGLAGPMIL